MMSHRLRCMQHRDGEALKIVESELPSWHLDDPLPSPAEQVDRLILWIGDHQLSPAENAEISESAISAIIGVAITHSARNRGLDWLLMQSELKPFIEVQQTETRDFAFSLTMAGWERHQALGRAEVESRTAFMAMQFGDPELNRAVETYFKPAVDRAGFELRLLSDGQPAGLIRFPAD